MYLCNFVIIMKIQVVKPRTGPLWRRLYLAVQSQIAALYPGRPLRMGGHRVAYCLENPSSGVASTDGVVIRGVNAISSQNIACTPSAGFGVSIPAIKSVRFAETSTVYSIDSGVKIERRSGESMPT